VADYKDVSLPMKVLRIGLDHRAAPVRNEICSRLHEISIEGEIASRKLRDVASPDASQAGNGVGRVT